MVWGQRVDQTAPLRELRMEKSRVPECLSGAQFQVTKLPSSIPHLLRVLPPPSISRDKAIGLEDTALRETLYDTASAQHSWIKLWAFKGLLRLDLA